MWNLFEDWGMFPKAVAVVLGLLGALFPRAVIDAGKTVLLAPTYENADELEPRGWYVTAVRVQSLLLALLGIAAFARDRQESVTDTLDDPELTPTDLTD